MKKLQVIIFSKDRACQLDLLIRSMKSQIPDRSEMQISILYTASSDLFRQGYDLLIAGHSGFYWENEQASPKSFKAWLLGLMDAAIDLTVFLVDDDIFRQPFSLKDAEVERFRSHHELLCLSLRLGENIDYCYPLDLVTPPPDFQSGYVWPWRGQKGDWGYPMSLDGHVFRTAQILPLLNQLTYENPNTLEFQLAVNPLQLPLMACYRESRLFNAPMNKVQSLFDNRTGDLDHHELNQRFVQVGERIRLEPLLGLRNRSAHQEMPFQFYRP